MLDEKTDETNFSWNYFGIPPVISILLYSCRVCFSKKNATVHSENVASLFARHLSLVTFRRLTYVTHKLKWTHWFVPTLLIGQNTSYLRSPRGQRMFNALQMVATYPDRLKHVHQNKLSWILCNKRSLILQIVSFIYPTDALFFFLRRYDPTWVMASSFLMFLDHTQRRSTVGRISLGEWSARRRDL